MAKLEIATEETVLEVLSLLEKNDICYWLDGGWGVDALAGKQTREHRDIDIDFDACQMDSLLQILQDVGYTMITDERPVRMELYHPQYSYIDIHPFVLLENGKAKQSDYEGGWFEFDADFFDKVCYKGRTIPCISLKGQKIFHTGYELREVDVHDIELLNSL